jgi:hypothetical protein
LHELFKDPLEVSERVGAVAADLFYEGVDDRAAPAGVLAVDEHPVLVPEFGGADDVFGEVVVEADDAPGEFAEAVLGFSGFDPADALAFERVGVLSVHPGFDLIDHADEQEDACGDARVFVAGFLELVRDAGEAGVGTAVVPVEDPAVFIMVIDPEVARRGFARAGLQTSHRGFVDLDVVATADAHGDPLVERQKPVGQVVVPGAHEVAGELDAVGGLEFPLLAVKGAVIAELLGE